MKNTLPFAALMVLLMALTQASTEKLPAGIRVEAEGVIVQKSDTEFRLRRHTGSEVVVVLTANTLGNTREQKVGSRMQPRTRKRSNNGGRNGQMRTSEFQQRA